MAGHSKWSTIKRKKAATDAKRGKLFTKLLREVQVAARQGGGNPDANARLKSAIAAARSGSVPADNIDRAIKRGSGDTDGENFEDITYEAYGPGGVALLIKALTDNKNRTVAEIRRVLTRNGGSLGESNSVGYLFEGKAVARIPKACGGHDAIFEKAIEAGAEDVEDGDDLWEVYASSDAMESLQSTFEPLGEDVQVVYQQVASAYIPVEGEEKDSLLQLLDQLEDLDDVQDVNGNFEFGDDEGEE